MFNVDFVDRVPKGTSGSGEVFYDSRGLEKLWSHGSVSVQDLTQGTASYCARYVVKKLTGDIGAAHYQVVDEDGVYQPITPPYCAMSLRPGIGKHWFLRYARDVFPHDFVICDGVKRSVPKYYDKLIKGADLEEVKFKRESEARKHFVDNTDERLAVREVVHKARVRNLIRGDVDG